MVFRGWVAVNGLEITRVHGWKVQAIANLANFACGCYNFHLKLLEGIKELYISCVFGSVVF